MSEGWMRMMRQAEQLSAEKKMRTEAGARCSNCNRSNVCANAGKYGNTICTDYQGTNKYMSSSIDAIKPPEKSNPQKKEKSKEKNPVSAPLNIPVGASADSLTKRGFLLLEDKEWLRADEYFENALNINPEYAPVYIGKLCVELKMKSIDRLARKAKTPLNKNRHFQRAVRFADDEYKSKLNELSHYVVNRLQKEKEEAAEKKRTEQMKKMKAEASRMAKEEKRKAEEDKRKAEQDKKKAEEEKRLTEEFRHKALRPDRTGGKILLSHNRNNLRISIKNRVRVTELIINGMVCAEHKALFLSGFTVETNVYKTQIKVVLSAAMNSELFINGHLVKSARFSERY